LSHWRRSPAKRTRKRALEADIARVARVVAILEERQKGLAVHTSSLTPPDRSLRQLRERIVGEELERRRDELAHLQACAADRLSPSPRAFRATATFAEAIWNALALLVRVAAACTAVVVVNSLLQGPESSVGTPSARPSPFATDESIGDLPTPAALAPEVTELSDWPLQAGWSATGGLLSNDGSDFGDANWLGELWNIHWVASPVQPPAADYAVEAEIEVVDRPPCGSFGLVARSAYQAGVHFCSEYGWPTVSIRSRTPELLIAVPFEPQPGWHVYRVEAQGQTLRILIDGLLIAEVENLSFVEPGQTGLWDDHTKMAVRRFDISQLDALESGASKRSAR
jgi:hypothetical protein